MTINRKQDLILIIYIVFKYLRINSFHKICRYCYSISNSDILPFRSILLLKNSSTKINKNVTFT